VYETNHPYERSKVQQFDAKYFPGAIALSLEFDRKCQSDQSHDFLTISSYYDYHNSNPGIELPLSKIFLSKGMGIGNTFKVSGKINIKKQIVLLGNTVEGDFASSAHSRDEHSLSRWGYR
jgi:other hect domain ubiquitin protein ligase E3